MISTDRDQVYNADDDYSSSFKDLFQNSISRLWNRRALEGVKLESLIDHLGLMIV